MMLMMTFKMKGERKRSSLMVAKALAEIARRHLKKLGARKIRIEPEQTLQPLVQ